MFLDGLFLDFRGQSLGLFFAKSCTALSDQDLGDRTRQLANALIRRGFRVRTERNALAGHESGGYDSAISSLRTTPDRNESVSDSPDLNARTTASVTPPGVEA